jgi:hypothetical protein
MLEGWKTLEEEEEKLGIVTPIYYIWYGTHRGNYW